MGQTKQRCPQCRLVGFREQPLCSHCLDGRDYRSDEELLDCPSCDGRFLRRVGSAKNCCLICRDEAKKVQPRMCECGNTFRSRKFDTCLKCRKQQHLTMMREKRIQDSKTIKFDCKFCKVAVQRYSSSDRSLEYCDTCIRMFKRVSKGDPNINAQKTLFKTAKRIAEKRGKAWDLKIEEYFRITSDPCFYCGCKLMWKGTHTLLDRKDSSLGYTEDNVLPCCDSCNLIRSNQLTVAEMCEFMKGVVEYRHQCNKIKEIF